MFQFHKGINAFMGRLNPPSAVGLDLAPYDIGQPITTFYPFSHNDWFRDGHVSSEGVVRVNLRTRAHNTGTKICLNEADSPREQVEVVW